MVELLLTKKVEKEEKEEEKIQSTEGGKIDQSSQFGNRNGTIKLIGEGKICSFDGTDKLYYKDVKKNFIQKNQYSQEIFINCLRKNWKTEKLKMTRNDTVMVKLDFIKKLTLPKGRTLYAKYNRVKIKSLPGNLKIRWPYSKRRSKCSSKRKKGAQTGVRLGTVAREALEQARKYYEKATSKKKQNNKLLKVLDSNVANTAVVDT